MTLDGRFVTSAVLEPVVEHVSQQTRAGLLQALAKLLPDSESCVAVLLRVDPCVRSVLGTFAQDLNAKLLPELTRALHLGPGHLHDFPPPGHQIGVPSTSTGLSLPQTSLAALSDTFLLQDASINSLGTSPMESRFAFAFSAPSAAATTVGSLPLTDNISAYSGGSSRLDLASGLAGLMNGSGANSNAALQAAMGSLSDSGLMTSGGLGNFSPGANDKWYRQPMFAGAPGRGNFAGGSRPQQPTWASPGGSMPNAPATPSPGQHGAQFANAAGAIAATLAGVANASSVSNPAPSPLDSASMPLPAFKPGELGQHLSALSPQLQLALQQQQQFMTGNAADVAASLMAGGLHGYTTDGAAVVTASTPVSMALNGLRLDSSGFQQQEAVRVSVNGSTASAHGGSAGTGDNAFNATLNASDQHQQLDGNTAGAGAGMQQQHPAANIGISPTSLSPGTSPASSVASSSSRAAVSMAAKLQQGSAAAAANKAKLSSAQQQQQIKPPADMPPRFRVLPPVVQCRIYTLTKDNHVVLLKDFDEKVVSKVCSLVDKFGPQECLAMLDRIEEVLKGKAGRLANGPGYLDVSVSTRLDELKQRAAGQVTAPEDFARSTLHSRIYAELKSLVEAHSFLCWEHFDQGIINMLKKMPNNLALERLNELRYHSFKNVDNVKSCVVSILSVKPKYSSAVAGVPGY